MGLRLPSATNYADTLKQDGCTFVDGKDLHIPPELIEAERALIEWWDRLVHDDHFSRNGVRFRRHDHFLVDPEGGIRLLTHAPFVIDETVDNSYGGKLREFEPLEDPRNAFLLAWIELLKTRIIGSRSGIETPQVVTIVPFRTIAPPSGKPVAISDGGPHQDGFDRLSISGVRRDAHARGGMSEIWSAEGDRLLREAISGWSTVAVDDRRLFHHGTPMRSTLPGTAAIRDVLITDWISVARLHPFYSDFWRGELPSK